jgi:acetoin:2,6-dichlorophenolindophenol oxidoreductase subunit alpha
MRPESVTNSQRTAPQGVEWLLEQWETMTLIRAAEECIAKLVETGEARCPCHLCIGQEAIAAGVCAALETKDTIWGGHRSHGHYLAKGASLEALFAEILGRVTGCASGRGGSMHLAAPEYGILGTVPIVAGTVPLAVGAAFSAKHFAPDEGSARPVAVAFFGDGTLEEGHVHESFNLAALYRLPIVFICENNLYASHMHWSERRRQDNLYQAGEYHGIPGRQVDGNDVRAVWAAASIAVKHARSGGGPTLIECRTFRWRGHVGASFDLDVGVKRRGELAEWLEKDPILVATRELEQLGVNDLQARRTQIDNRIERAINEARRAKEPTPTRLGDFVWCAEDPDSFRESPAFLPEPLAMEALCAS